MPLRKHKKSLPPKLWRLDSYPDTSHSEVMSEINRQLNAKLHLGRGQRHVIKHGLEAGLIAENAVREVISVVLPKRYGVAKGKLVNAAGMMSRHLDVIVYDALNYPSFFLDGNGNQILPVEAALYVIEVKSRTSRAALREAFAQLASVAELHTFEDCSTNDYLNYCPPGLLVMSLEDPRRLTTILKDFVDLNKGHRVPQSFARYSAKSPGSKEATGDTYMVHAVIVAGKGSVYSMLNGQVAIGDWGENTIGLELSGMIGELAQIALPGHKGTAYLSWITSGSRRIYTPR
jgi:hypothetical protein